MIREAHSARYIDDSRSDWWSADFLRTFLSRFTEQPISSVCDLGIGAGHWTSVLANALGAFDRVVGVDTDARWVVEARQKLSAAMPHTVIEVVQADACSTGEVDGSFDLVTCQTLLMHVGRPEMVIAEMRRVVRPGGIVLIAEPINAINRSMLLDAIRFLAPEQAADLLRVWLTYHRAVKEVHGYDYDVGLRLPDLFEAAGLSGAQFAFNEKADLTPSQAFSVDWALEEADRVDIAGFTKGLVTGSEWLKLKASLRELETAIQSKSTVMLASGALVLGCATF